VEIESSATENEPEVLKKKKKNRQRSSSEDDDSDFESMPTSDVIWGRATGAFPPV